MASRWFKVSLSLGLLCILVSSVDVAHLVRQLQSARLDYIGLAFCGYLLGQALSAYRWRLLARPLGFGQPLKTFIAYYFAGMYLNLFAPSVVAGDAGRSYLLAQGRARLGVALQSVLADRVSGLAMLVWVSAGGFLLWGPSVLPVELYYGVLATAGGSVVLWWGLPWLVERCVPPGNIVRRSIDQLILPYRTDPALLGCACGLSVGFHLFQLGLHAVVAAALGLAVPLWYLVLFFYPGGPNLERPARQSWRAGDTRGRLCSVSCPVGDRAGRGARLWLGLERHRAGSEYLWRLGLPRLSRGWFLNRDA